MTYQECVKYVLSIPLFADKLGTDNLSQILEIMGHPERSCFTIHVAGTNGKGSTCSFLASILEKAGKKVGLFTSPHLISINERIRIGQNIITNEEFVETFQKTKRYVEEAEKIGISHPSFFEFIFLMATIYFEEKETEYVIYETGMGGAMDATNVLQPICSIITSVGLDHMQFLGNTLEEIAKQKAGIIKEKVPILFFDRKDIATTVISEQANKVGTKLYLVEKSQFNLNEITDKGIDFSFDSGYYKYDNLRIRKTALYQVENAMLAVKAYELIFRDFGLNLNAIYQGLYDMVWRGRMECIAKNIYVDGAHNQEAIEAFCNTLEILFPKEPKLLLFAVSKDKDYKHMIERLCKIPFTEILIVQYEGSRAANLVDVEENFRRYSNSKITTFEDMKAGYLYGKSQTEKQLLFCVGSLYLVGELLNLGE